MEPAAARSGRWGGHQSPSPGEGWTDGGEGEGPAPASPAAGMAFGTQSPPRLAGARGFKLLRAGSLKLGKERHFPSTLPLHLPAGAATPAPGNDFPQIRQMLGAGTCLQGRGPQRPPCTSRGESDGGSRRESGLVAGGGKWEKLPHSPRKRQQKAPSWAATFVC